jgi:hypothetical protein
LRTGENVALVEESSYSTEQAVFEKHQLLPAAPNSALLKTWSTEL